MDIIIQPRGCPRTFIPMWIEQPGDPHPTKPKLPYKSTIDYVVMRCDTKEIVSELTVSVSNAYQVLSTIDTRLLDQQETAALYRSYPGNPSNYNDLPRTFIDATDIAPFSEGVQYSDLQ